LIEKLTKYHENYEKAEKNFFTDKEKKEIFLFILEIAYKEPDHQYVLMVNHAVQANTLSFEGRLQYYLGINIDDFKKYQSNDRIFATKYSNILTTQIQESVKIVLEQLMQKSADIPTLKQKLTSLENVLKMLGREDGEVSTALPIAQYQKFLWDFLINDVKVISDVIYEIVNDVVVLRAKELLNNTQLSDDGNEMVINKDYNMPIEVIYNGENIANDVEIRNLNKVIYVEHKDIRTRLYNAIIKLIASGKIKEKIIEN
jgi:hypothetical protein